MQMQIFDPAHFTSDNCPTGLMTTPAGTYCQMMGPYEMPLNDYNTIAMYPGINNNCPSQVWAALPQFSLPFSQAICFSVPRPGAALRHRASVMSRAPAGCCAQWPEYQRCPASDPKCQC
jgi:hypothetical protein